MGSLRAALLVGSLVLPSVASAHPLPSSRYDRAVSVRLDPAGVRVRYTLEVTQLTIWLDGARLFTPEEIAGLDRTGRGFAAAYARKVAPELARDLRATADGAPLAFRAESIDVESGEHPRFTFLFRADWPPGGDRRAFTFEDESFDGKPGVLALTVSEGGGVRLDDLIEPDPRWREKPAIDLSPEQAAALRRASGVVVLPGPIPGPQAIAPEQAVDAPRSPEPAPPEPVVSEGERPGLLADLFTRGLPALFDSSYGLGMLLLAAALFGAAHAFTPGHGKTLVAAYLVGERGTVGHAVLLAVATTVAHTGSVILVAVILWSAYGNVVPGATQGVLQFVGGLLVAGVGAWLLMRRLAGRADHVHLFGGHHHHHHHGDGHHHHHHGDGDHHHHHGPPPESARTTAGWARLVLMGVGGGLIPCWDAVLLLLAATALNRVGFALPLLFAFSLGLGAVLVALGVGVVYAHKAGAGRFGESRWFRLLPMLSAALLLGLGLWLCREGVRAAMQ
jgi:ABC-type nickel/cobalt efflux system permease component RcnA